MSTSERLEKLGKGKGEYECKRCNFKFTRGIGYNGKCPYCSEDAVIPRVVENPIQEIDDLI